MNLKESEIPPNLSFHKFLKIKLFKNTLSGFEPFNSMFFSMDSLLGDPEVTTNTYILQITQPSQLGYAKLQHRFAVTWG